MLLNPKLVLAALLLAATCAPATNPEDPPAFALPCGSSRTAGFVPAQPSFVATPTHTDPVAANISDWARWRALPNCAPSYCPSYSPPVSAYRWTDTFTQPGCEWREREREREEGEGEEEEEEEEEEGVR